jgi:hypothetical protein
MPLGVRIARGLAATSVVAALVGLAELVEPQLAATAKYPEPRFPAYLKPPRTVDDVMPAAREIVRNKNGIQGAGMGVLQKGDGVLLVPTMEAEPMILDAIAKALAERGVKVDVKYNYELVGVPREDAAALLKQRESFTSEDGYMEAVGWIENQFADPEVPKKWLKERRPELYAKLFPRSREMTPHTKQVWEKLKRDSVGPGIVAYLGKHPELRGAYWGKGGSTGLRRALNPVPQKFLGILWQDNRYEVMSQIGSFPADVWQLSEEKTLEPLAHVDQIRVTDPEGTDITADVNEVQAQRWAQGSYQRGHLYMFPNQATGRFGYSVVDYPAFQKQWLPREPIVRANGVIAGTHNHVGMYPRWEVRLKDGYIVGVTGGGTYGDILREFLQYPGTQDLVYPFHKNPGFWYLYEAAFGTHPKYFRNPKELMEGSLGPDRLHAGVIHWGLGIRLWHDPDGPVESKQWMEFTAKHNVPRDHSFHTHTYFSSYRLRIRGANQWVDILDKGRMTSLDDPEVKALASRYGDPARILADDWIIDMPGVSAPGSYEQYAKDPWTYEKAVVDKAVAGTYEYYYPRPGAAAAARAGGE